MVKMINPLFLAALCLLLSFASAVTENVEPCNKKTDYPVKVKGLDVSPYPISRGRNTTFAISAHTDTPISGGKMKIEVNYFFFSVYSETKNLCTETSCPVPAGDFVVSHTQELPGITPPGNYHLKMTMLDAKNKQLACFNYDFGIGFIAEEEGVASM